MEDMEDRLQMVGMLVAEARAFMYVFREGPLFSRDRYRF